MLYEENKLEKGSCSLDYACTLCMNNERRLIDLEVREMYLHCFEGKIIICKDLTL